MKAAVLAGAVSLCSAAGAEKPEVFRWNGEPWRVGSGGDPAGSWLSYAVYKAPAGSLITRVNTSWTVPTGKPTRSGSNAPGWWYGVQTAKGNGALVQPILACDYMGSSCEQGTYVAFDGVFDWTTPWHGMYESKALSAKEGDKINSWLTCTTEQCTQYIANERTGESATFPYKLHNPSSDKESALYFVLEHQPSNCDAFPPNGVCVFSDIYVEVDGKAVTPQWEAKQEQPACGSKMTVVDSKTLAITWNGGTPPTPAKEELRFNGQPWKVEAGGDPAGSWLSYASYTAPAGSLITRVNTSWTVPVGKPTRSGSNAPGWWYGVQTAAGNGALVQPILACDYQGSSCEQGTYVAFDGVYDWTTPWHGMYESRALSAKEGDKINSWLTCTTEQCTQYIANERTGETATFPYKLHNPSSDKESVLYFVLEHQPSSCEAFPPNGVCVFSDIYVEVDGKAVTPQWVAKQERPACDSKMTVVDSKTLAITWNGGTPPSSSDSVVV